MTRSLGERGKHLMCWKQPSIQDANARIFISKWFILNTNNFLISKTMATRKASGSKWTLLWTCRSWNYAEVATHYPICFCPHLTSKEEDRQKRLKFNKASLFQTLKNHQGHKYTRIFFQIHRFQAMRFLWGKFGVCHCCPTSSFFTPKRAKFHTFLAFS